MLKLAADADLRAAMGRRARERVTTNFDLTAQAAHVADWLEEAVPRPARWVTELRTRR